MLADFINKDSAFSTYTFERLMNNNLKRLNMLRSFSKKRLTKDFLKDKNVLEINATNSSFANYLFENGICSYNGLNFNPDIVSKLNKENNNNLSSYNLLENNIKFNRYKDVDLVISFGFIESLSRFEVFSFFEKSKDLFHLHSMLNNSSSSVQSAINQIIDTASLNVHNTDYLLAALGDEKTWGIDNSSNFRDYSIIRNF